MEMDMAMNSAAATTSSMSMATAIATAASKSMTMGENSGCKLSMLLNWNTIDACFLSSHLHIHTPFIFFLTCLSSFLLVISLEFLRRLQRGFDRRLRARNSLLREKGYQYDIPVEEIEEKLLKEDGGLVRSGENWRVVIEQSLRGVIHAVQFAVSYCVMLLFMYSNGYIIISILVGSLVGFAMFTRDTLDAKGVDGEKDERDNNCC